MIAVSFPTIMDGTVVRWYANGEAFANSNETVSASRNGVHARGYVTREQYDAADAIHQRLKADVSDAVTHTSGLFSRVLKPVER
jgi:hypothetical protein